MKSAIALVRLRLAVIAAIYEVRMQKRRWKEALLMRIVLLVIGYVLSIGALLNSAFAVVALFYVAKDYFIDPAMSVETLFREHVQFMLWTRSAAEAILPAHVAEFFFSAPALVIFPLRAAVAGALGFWALKAAAGGGKAI